MRLVFSENVFYSKDSTISATNVSKNNEYLRRTKDSFLNYSYRRVLVLLI